MSLSIYIHIPFCVRKCLYCDFYSLPGQPVEESAYLERLIRELRYYRTLLQADDRPLSTIYFGGGTPSICQGATIRAILDEVRRLWLLREDCEISLEVNPESCTMERLKIWCDAGVNRFSLGIQALDDHRLRMLGRPHDVVMARQAVERLSGWGRLSVDLMYGTPGHTVAGWQAELEEVLRWGVDHLSCYALTLEPGTRLQQWVDEGKLVMPEEEEAVLLFTFTRTFLRDHGFDPYEISNFARRGEECRHNINYWEFGDYLGVGSAAHGQWRDDKGMIWRSENPRDLSTWDVNPRGIAWEEAGRECLMMGLRLRCGMKRATYAGIMGQDLGVARKNIVDTLEQEGCLVVEKERIRIKELYMILSDAIILDLF